MQIAEINGITTGGTGENGSVRSFIEGTRKRRGQECPRHTSDHYFFRDDW